MTQLPLPALLQGSPFDCVLDVGGNIGLFSEEAHAAWPDATIFSFEPLPGAAQANRERAAGRWTVYECAVGEHADTLPLRFCVNQHTASTMQAPGTARRKHFGIADRFETLLVDVQPLDRFFPLVERCESLLVKVDVEGHELQVLKGARRTLDHAVTVVCEVQQDPAIFLGSPAPWTVDGLLRRHGLRFAGCADAFMAPDGELLQFDGVWSRQLGPWREQSEHIAENATALASDLLDKCRR